MNKEKIIRENIDKIIHIINEEAEFIQKNCKITKIECLFHINSIHVKLQELQHDLNCKKTCKVIKNESKG